MTTRPPGRRREGRGLPCAAGCGERQWRRPRCGPRRAWFQAGGRDIEHDRGGVLPAVAPAARRGLRGEVEEQPLGLDRQRRLAGAALSTGERITPHRSVHGAAALGRGNLQSGVGPQAGSGASDRWCPRDEARHWAQEPGEQPRNSPLPARRQTRDARRPRRPPSRGRGQPCGVSSSCPLAEPQPPEEASFLFPRRPVSGSSPKRCPASGTSALSPDVATGRSRWRKRGRANGIRLLHRRRVSTSPVNEREPSEDHRPACKPDGRQVVSSGACH